MIETEDVIGVLTDRGFSSMFSWRIGPRACLVMTIPSSMVPTEWVSLE